MQKSIETNYLIYTKEQMRSLEASSDVVHVLKESEDIFPKYYIVAFEGIEHLTKGTDGTVHKSMEPLIIEICLPRDYLRSVDPNLGIRVVGIVSPIFHPNIFAPAMCLGTAFQAGTPVHEILRMVYELVSYQVMTADEGDALNPEACRFVRENPDLLQSLRRKPFRHRHSQLKSKAYIVTDKKGEQPC